MTGPVPLHDPCRSGLASRKGRAAAPGFSATTNIAGAAAQPFRDARPLLQRPIQMANTEA
ncbi:hypothetical protein MD26_11145 [Pseudomonas sp. H2]|nr:hypothetical protein MD26_11145 [Pseudomonas sp. H2]